jgi:hypothetical protein
MSRIKQVLLAIGLGVLATIGGGVIAFLNEVHLEISFDKLKDFKVTDLASYVKLGTALRFELETAADQEYIAYWVDDDDGKAVVRRSGISYKNFRLNNRVAGNLIDDDDHASYAITGYYNSHKIVFSHRGPFQGTGVYILDLIQLDNITRNIYAGYSIIDKQVERGSTKYQVLQCPFVMIDETTALKSFPAIADAKKAFPFLGGVCTPFKMPGNVTAAVVR